MAGAAAIPGEEAVVPRDSGRLAVFAVISVLVHAIAVSLIFSIDEASGSDAADARLATAPPPDSANDVKLGVDDSNAVTINWLGFADPTPHEAVQSVTDQAALAMAGAASQPTEPRPSAPAATPQEPVPPSPPRPRSEPTPVPQPEPVEPAEEPVDPEPSPQRDTMTVAPAPEGVEDAVPTQAASEALVVIDPIESEAEETEGELPDTTGEEVVSEPEVAPAPETTQESAEPTPPQPPTEPTPPQQPQQVSPASQPSEPTPPAEAQQSDDQGEPSDREADATAVLPPQNPQRWGRPIAGPGLRIRTVKPDVAIFRRILFSTRPAKVIITFLPDGKAELVEFARNPLTGEMANTGNGEWDRELIQAVYRWRAEGQTLRDIFERRGEEGRLRVEMTVHTR